MKLAEALSLRGALVQNVNQLKALLTSCVKVQEGDEPLDTPADVLKRLDETLGELQQLVFRINITNTQTLVEGESLTALIARRDMLKIRTQSLADALASLREQPNRYSRSEIKFVRTVSIDDFRKIYDRSAKELRELDLKIQGAGWVTELVGG